MPSESNHLMAGKRAQGGVDWQRTPPRVTAGSRRIRNATTGAEDQSTFQFSSGRTGESRSGSYGWIRAQTMVPYQGPANTANCTPRRPLAAADRLIPSQTAGDIHLP
ncbi:hypothetical protein CPLU01_06113 [Colletotrichum plurivorum]|uniref:Uncharacterized protein n=1 Tax=Colletotrichum plurivorum TaxID=2175906 RepID=A0A8H6KKU4_9PEZI|nr:hypothetical protein CPLU01_06113 [Colletotrichum plurivorum]